ncbi:MAG: glycosyltransferase family 4 protein [Bacteroidia bacterium]
MKVVVNTRLLLSGRLEGIGWFTYEILKRVVKNNPEVEFYFLFDRKYNQEFVFSKNVTPIVLYPQARNVLLFKIWFDFSVKRALNQIKPDIFISPDGYLSLNTNTPQIPVIHDLNFEHHPNDMPKKYLNFYKKYFPLFAKKAKHIITVSEYSKQDISKTYGINSENISVVYNAPAEIYKPLSAINKNKIREKYTNGKPYFIYVGSINARKNPVNLLKAFDVFKSKFKSDFKLLMVGSKMWNYPEFDSTLNNMKHKNEVIFLGHTERENLSKLVASAQALMFLSYFEGFGIPLVEAMKTETAILTTNYTAMPEVCGDAALYANPFDVEDIAKKMQQLSTDDVFVKSLIEKGKQQVQKFNWDKSAEKFWEVVVRTIKHA